ncbi:MAG TPA: M1 family aminopeptidase [Bacteroidales bacterium]|nr:M1 family aminopeptidase [Bacteroidales bacterium]
MFIDIKAQKNEHVVYQICEKNNNESNILKLKQSPKINDYDVYFYFLDLNIERTSVYVSGNVSIYAKVVAPLLDTFVCELHSNLNVDSIKLNGQNVSFNHISDEIYVPVIPNIATNTSFSVQIFYKGTPPTGGFFSGISNATSPTWGNQVTWTLSEPFNAYQWWPCKQVLTDKADSAWIFITTNNQNKAGANGILTGITPMPNNKLRYEWKTRYPIAYYLISASVAKYIDYSIYAKPASLINDSILIQNFVYDNPSTLNYFKSQIDLTVDFINLYSDLYGLYPFWKEKYGHCMAPLGGGMEHQTMTTLGSFSFYLTCHELSHQWFGDNVTCASWSDIWINEGFADYSEYLAAQYLISQTEADNQMLNKHNNIMSQPGGSVYIPPYLAVDENRIFDQRLSYNKGGAIIHMIRFELQDDTVFFNVLKNFQAQFGKSVATGLDLKNVLETTSGKNFTDFFNQWYFGEGYPTFDIIWEYKNDTVYFSSTQFTSTTVTPLFKMLMEYKFVGPVGDTTIRVYQNNFINHYKIPVSKPVTNIIVDPNNWVINGNGSVILNLKEPQNTLCFTVFPNPSENYISLNLFDDNYKDCYSVNIYDMTGKLVFSKNYNEPNIIIDISKLFKGIYIVKAFNDRDSYIKKIVKN